jgi:hypothetical protein
MYRQSLGLDSSISKKRKRKKNGDLRCKCSIEAAVHDLFDRQKRSVPVIIARLAYEIPSGSFSSCNRRFSTRQARESSTSRLNPSRRGSELTIRLRSDSARFCTILIAFVIAQQVHVRRIRRVFCNALLIEARNRFESFFSTFHEWTPL